MKIRSGFVSNSSSSSFIIRGIRISREEFEKHIDYMPELKKGGVFSWELEKKLQLNIHPDTNYFEHEPDDEVKDLIVGKSLDSLDDGIFKEICENPELDKELNKIFEQLGIHYNKLSTFIQYISNDNC